MGFKRYLSWYDAIYGLTGDRINNNNNVSQDSFMATYTLIWTVNHI